MITEASRQISLVTWHHLQMISLPLALLTPADCQTPTQSWLFSFPTNIIHSNETMPMTLMPRPRVLRLSQSSTLLRRKFIQLLNTKMLTTAGFFNIYSHANSTIWMTKLNKVLAGGVCQKAQFLTAYVLS